MAIDVNGSSGYVNVGKDSSLKPSAAVSYTAWINADSAGELSGGRIIDIQNNAITMFSSNRCNYYVGTTTGNKDVQGNVNSITFGTDHFVCLTNDGTTLYGYVDGVQQTDTQAVTGTMNYASNTDMYLGNSPVNIDARTFDGRMWDVRVYTRALSQEEINILYHSRGSDNIVNGLTGRWMLNEKTEDATASGASSIIDISGSSNNGTPSGTLTYKAKPIKITGVNNV
jgi:hypothetical protein